MAKSALEDPTVVGTDKGKKDTVISRYPTTFALDLSLLSFVNCFFLIQFSVSTMEDITAIQALEELKVVGIGKGKANRVTCS